MVCKGFWMSLRNLINALIRNRKTLIALSAVVVFVTTYLLILPAATLEKGAAEEMGEAYSQGIAALQTPLHLVLVIVLTAAMGVFGIWICNKGMKKSANLLA